MNLGFFVLSNEIIFLKQITGIISGGIFNEEIKSIDHYEFNDDFFS